MYLVAPKLLVNNQLIGELNSSFRQKLGTQFSSQFPNGFVVDTPLITYPDLTAERKIETVQALNWAAREKVKFFEVSAFDRESLYEPFVYLVSKLNPPPNKNTFTQLTMGRAKQHKQSE